MEEEKQQKKFGIEQLEHQLSRLTKTHKLMILSGLTLVVILLISVLTLPKINHRIREKQIASVVANSFYNGDEIKRVPQDGLATLIQEKNEVTVLIYDPASPFVPELETVLTNPDQLKLFPTVLYVYPIFYDKKEVKKDYQLQADITLIQYTNHKEAKRVKFKDKTEIEMYFVDYLESLTNRP